MFFGSLLIGVLICVSVHQISASGRLDDRSDRLIRFCRLAITGTQLNGDEPTLCADYCERYLGIQCPHFPANQLHELLQCIKMEHPDCDERFKQGWEEQTELKYSVWIQAYEFCESLEGPTAQQTEECKFVCTRLLASGGHPCDQGLMSSMASFRWCLRSWTVTLVGCCHKDLACD